MLIKTHKQRGVSLIELIVGLSILAILLAVGAPSFVTYLENSNIRSAANAIQNGLNLARAEAVRRNTHVRFVLGDGGSWTVGCESATDDCPANIQNRPAGENSTRTRVVASEVNAATGAESMAPLFTTTLVFNGFGQVTATSVSPGNNGVFNITDVAENSCRVDGGTRQCLRVEVSAGGQVRMCDPALSGGDPRAC